MWDGTDLIYTSNRNSHPRALEPGVHGLANTHLDGTIWPKVTSGTRELHNIIRGDYSPNDLMKLLADERIPSDELLPKRGNDLAFERRVAPIFIRGEEYGTRACSAVTITTTQIRFAEQTFGPNGAPLERVEETLPILRSP